MSNVWIALLLTALAGLSTGIGSVIAFFCKEMDMKFLSVSLGFSAGVMIYVSMMEIYGKSIRCLHPVYGEKLGSAVAVLAFFGGMLFIGIIDRLLPAGEKGLSTLTKKDTGTGEGAKNGALLRTGVFTALVMSIHNFPEGLATFVSALQEPSLAIPIVFAIAIHNIPEGIAVSVPVYYATGSKKKAFLISFLSGLTEPIGAVIGYLLLMPFMSETVNGILYAAVAGIMVFISLDELLPAAHEYGTRHLAMYGLVGGMAVMAASLLLFL
ncbi:zinc transporter ZupT [Oscillospiraceae bacterium OttesenSCG-928-G22]|nr:zinc transporter ZupT [Oscillospiraceae bacterium OttesenSCG-928-G22]